MEAFLASLDFTVFPAYGLLAFAVYLILTGKLQWHKVADDWRDAHLKSEEANKELLRQNSELIEAGRTTTKVVSALREAGGGEKT